MRGQLRTYCNARIFTLFFSAFLSVMPGFLLFIVFLKMNYTWKLEYDTAFDASAHTGAFRTVLSGGFYVLYYVLVSVQQGILAGIVIDGAAFLENFGGMDNLA